ncbi:MAG: addiction module protein [Phycisphaeraceae bacterium]
MTLTHALNTARELNPGDRIELMRLLLADLAREQASELTDEQKAELDRRIADDDAHPDDAIPWEQVEAEARARLRR